MTLGELIRWLESQPQDRIMARGFGRPHSWRGVYAEVSFPPKDNVRVGDMLAYARSAIGPVFEGYKGGDNTYDEYTPVHLSEYGSSTEEPTMGLLLASDSLAEIARLRVQLSAAEKMAEAARAELALLSDDYSVMQHPTTTALRATLAEWDKERGTR